MSIENQESQKEKNRLEELQDLIINAPERIENEFSRTANDWLSCFGSSVFQVETYLSSPKVKALLSTEKYELAEKRIEELKEKLYQLKEQYSDKETIPPEDIKRELITELNILREEN